MTFEALLKENQSLKKQIHEITLDSQKEKRQSLNAYDDINHLKEQIDELSVVVENKNSMIKTQQVRIDELLKRIYGRRSEKLDTDQIVFDEIILEADKKNKQPEADPVDPVVKEQIIKEHIRRTHPGRKPLPEHLERVEHYLDIPEEDKLTADGKERPMIGVDITEKLDYKPSVFVVNRYIRPKYGADDDIEGSGVKQHPPVE